MDTKIKACRICLITDVKMYYIDNVLEDYISLLATDDTYIRFPNYICFECASLLVKFIKFRKKYIEAQSIISNMLKECSEIKEQGIKGINHSTFALKSCLGHRKLSPISFSKKNITTEMTVHEATTPDYEIKPEVYIKPDIEESEPDDDDQALAEEEIEFNIDIKPYIEENEPNDEDPVITVDAGVKFEKVGTPTVKEQSGDKPTIGLKANGRTKHKSNSKLKVAKEIQKRKRGQTRKRGAAPKTNEQKPKRTKKTSKMIENDIDLEKYVTIIKLSMEEQLEELEKRKQSSNYLNTPFQCNQCYRGFIHTHAWKHHLLKHDPSAGDLVCPVCKFRFKKKRLLRDHSKRNHEMKYICKSCPYISRREVQARLHQKWHDGITYKCKHCDEVCTKWTSYLSHVRIKHPSEFICDVCGCSFISKLGVVLHKNKMHKGVIENAGGDGETEPGPYCKECDIKFVSVEAWNRHMVISDKHKQTVHFENLCRVCGKTFESSEDLQVHHKKEHAPKPLKSYPYPKFRTTMTWPAKCEHCSEEISNARQYWGHYRQMHPNEIYPLKRNHEYVCDICGKRFPTNTVLVYHKRTHSEEREFKCGTCGKAFHNRANLQTHVTQTHSDLRPFPCALCSKAFKCKGALSRHSRSHTGAKPYTCELCGKSFSQSNSRKLHVRTVHLKQPPPPRVRRRAPSSRTPPTPSTTVGTDTDTPLG